MKIILDFLHCFFSECTAIWIFVLAEALYLYFFFFVAETRHWKPNSLGQVNSICYSTHKHFTVQARKTWESRVDCWSIDQKNKKISFAYAKQK